MGFILFILFILLVLSLAISGIRGKYARLSRFFRLSTVIFGISFFSYVIFEKNVEPLHHGEARFQVSNKFPQTLDFFVIKESASGKAINKSIEHIGKIRSEYYRTVNFTPNENADYEIAGFLGDDDLVYFENVGKIKPNQNFIAENYSILGDEASKEISKMIKNLDSNNFDFGIWSTIILLLLFLNTVLLFRKK